MISQAGDFGPVTMRRIWIIAIGVFRNCLSGAREVIIPIQLCFLSWVYQWIPGWDLGLGDKADIHIPFPWRTVIAHRVFGEFAPAFLVTRFL